MIINLLGLNVFAKDSILAIQQFTGILKLSIGTFMRSIKIFAQLMLLKRLIQFTIIALEKCCLILQMEKFLNKMRRIKLKASKIVEFKKFNIKEILNI
jgi:hypothetical protein